MTRNQYWEKLRNLLQELPDRSIGIYVAHNMGLIRTTTANPHIPDHIELSERLFPSFSKEHGEEIVCSQNHLTVDKLYKFVQHIENNRDKHSSDRAKTRYESEILALGQRARALLCGDPAEKWNVVTAQIKKLEKQFESAEQTAISYEQTANYQRKIADDLKCKLLSKLQELIKIETIYKP